MNTQHHAAFAAARAIPAEDLAIMMEDTRARLARHAEPVRLYIGPSCFPGHVLVRVRGEAGEVTVIAPRDSRANALRAALQLAGGAA